MDKIISKTTISLFYNTRVPAVDGVNHAPNRLSIYRHPSFEALPLSR